VSHFEGREEEKRVPYKIEGGKVRSEGKKYTDVELTPSKSPKRRPNLFIMENEGSKRKDWDLKKY